MEDKGHNLQVCWLTLITTVEILKLVFSIFICSNMTQIFFLSESGPAKGPEGTHEDTWLWKNVPSSSLSLSPPTMPSAFQSTSDSGQPSWMELAKRKSMAWSDKSMDWEEKHRHIVVHYEQPCRHIMLLNSWRVSQKGADSTLLRLLLFVYWILFNCKVLWWETERSYCILKSP